MTRYLTLLLAGLVASAAAQSQQIYRWVDRDGVVHYADQPGAPDAKPVEYLVKPPADAEASNRDEDAGDEQSESSTAPSSYSSVSISSPSPDQVFFGADESIPVSIDVDPPLRNGDRIAVLLDGKRVTDSLTGNSYTLTSPARGSHFLRVAVLDAAGRMQLQSNAVTFHVRQHSVAKPPVGPALRPPPKKKP